MRSPLDPAGGSPATAAFAGLLPGWPSPGPVPLRRFGFDKAHRTHPGTRLAGCCDVRGLCSPPDTPSARPPWRQSPLPGPSAGAGHIHRSWPPSRVRHSTPEPSPPRPAAGNLCSPLPRTFLPAPRSAWEASQKAGPDRPARSRRTPGRRPPAGANNPRLSSPVFSAPKQSGADTNPRRPPGHSGTSRQYPHCPAAAQAGAAPLPATAPPPSPAPRSPSGISSPAAAAAPPAAETAPGSARYTATPSGPLRTRPPPRPERAGGSLPRSPRSPGCPAGSRRPSPPATAKAKPPQNTSRAAAPFFLAVPAHGPNQRPPQHRPPPPPKAAEASAGRRIGSKHNAESP